MSISYCTECGRTVEGETLFCRGCDSIICTHCGCLTEEVNDELGDEEGPSEV